MAQETPFSIEREREENRKAAEAAREESSRREAARVKASEESRADKPGSKQAEKQANKPSDKQADEGEERQAALLKATEKATVTHGHLHVNGKDYDLSEFTYCQIAQPRREGKRSHRRFGTWFLLMKGNQIGEEFEISSAEEGKRLELLCKPYFNENRV